MSSWMIVGLLALGAVACFVNVATILKRHEHEQLSKLYNATQWRMPYLSMTGDAVFFVVTHRDNICRECEGVKDTRKIEFERPGRARVLTCVCSRSFGDEGWRWVSGGSHL